MDNSKLKPYFIFGEDLIDEKAKAQFFDCLAADYSLRGALMADAHLGYSLPIGGVMWTQGVIVPSYIGFDIGCGMQAIRTTYDLDEVRNNIDNIYNTMRSFIPTGFKHHSNQTRQTTLHRATGMSATNFFRELYNDVNGDNQLGTMGGNNHYIEIGSDYSGNVCFVVHSGSRGLGHKIASHYMAIAAGGKAREGNYPLDLDSPEGQSYWYDMQACMCFAKQNRMTLLSMVDQVMLKCGLIGEIKQVTLLDTMHNYAQLINPERQEIIHRKGATKILPFGRESIIAGNPVVGTFIVSGNPDRPVSLDSVSHGMGRVSSRKKAKETITPAMVTEQMGRVVGGIKCDEAPSAYKPVGDVMDAQSDLILIENQIKPLLCLKG